MKPYPDKPLISDCCNQPAPPPPDGCVPPCPPPPPAPPAWPPSREPWAFGQIPPVPSVLEGSSLYEAMNGLVKRVNACVQQWNSISYNCFAAMNQCVEAARANDVYYDKDEVSYTEGYSEDDACAYSLVTKKAVDKAGRPIFTNLMLAYDNTTNSGVKQDIFDVSFIKSANVIMTAVPPAQTTWYGPAMYRGAPIPGTDPNSPAESNPLPSTMGEVTRDGDNTPYWVYGFSRSGKLKWFEGTNLTTQNLSQNGMVDVIGGCIPALNKGELTEQIQQQTAPCSIGAVGFRESDGTTYFLSASGQDQPGMTGVSVAKILQGFGCTSAVLTYAVPASNLNESAGMLYMGQMTAVPQGGLVPKNLGYWVISKKPNFRNGFQQEIADLVQTTGQNAWRIYLSRVELEAVSDRVTQNHNDILAEVERAEAAEAALKQDITNETNRATEAESNLDAKIEAETTRAETAETGLDAKITAETSRAQTEESKLDAAIKQETARATQAELDLQDNINDEVNRAEKAESDLQANINAEVNRATSRETEIQSALDSEIAKRIAADNDLINAIEQEVLARKAADTAIQNSVDALDAKTSGQITGLQTSVSDINSTISGITGGQTNLPYLPLTGGTLTGNLKMSPGYTVTVGRGPTADLEVATKKYVDDAIQTGGGGGTGGDVSKEYVDQQIAAVNENIAANQEAIDTKVSKAGDTMTGPLTLSGAPTADLQAATKAYVDSQTAAVPVSDYLPLAGGKMADDAAISSDATLKLQTADGVIFSNGQGDGSNLYGVSTINHWPPDMTDQQDDITIKDTEIDVMSPLKVVDSAGAAAGTLEAGTVKGPDDLVLQVGSSSGNVVIPSDVNTFAGLETMGVYMTENRADGSKYKYGFIGAGPGSGMHLQTTGGLELVRIDSDGNILTTPKPVIHNLGDGTAANDAVNFGQLNAVKNMSLPTNSLSIVKAIYKLRVNENIELSIPYPTNSEFVLLNITYGNSNGNSEYGVCTNFVDLNSPKPLIYATPNRTSEYRLSLSLNNNTLVLNTSLLSNLGNYQRTLVVEAIFY